ncbi:MAG: dephospho-CoA kinase [Gammaproteobacteria bacterium]
MLTVGLTGGIASGKSEAAQVFAALGAPVVDADVIAREVLARGSAGLATLAAALGADILTPAGELDRARLRQRVFATPALRRKVEAITHPLVREQIRRRLLALAAPYAIVMAPLLVESGLDRELDRILVTDCAESVQLERLIARDGENEGSARRMLAAQATRAERLAAADDVVVNDGSLENLEAAVRECHVRYLRLAQGL